MGWEWASGTTRGQAMKLQLCLSVECWPLEYLVSVASTVALLDTPVPQCPWASASPVSLRGLNVATSLQLWAGCGHCASYYFWRLDRRDSHVIYLNVDTFDDDTLLCIISNATLGSYLVVLQFTGANFWLVLILNLQLNSSSRGFSSTQAAVKVTGAPLLEFPLIIHQWAVLKINALYWSMKGKSTLEDQTFGRKDRKRNETWCCGSRLDFNLEVSELRWIHAN